MSRALDCSFWKTAENSSDLTFFNLSVSASWISATSAKWVLLISFLTWGTENSLTEINLESARMSWQDMARSRNVEQNVHTTFSFPNPLSESEKLQSWGCSTILLSFLMRFDGHFWPNHTTDIRRAENVWFFCALWILKAAE